MTKAKMQSKTDVLLDELLEGCESPEDIFGKHGLVKRLTKRLVERALRAELTAHLGYAPHAPEGRGAGNTRNGSTAKTVQTAHGDLSLQTPRDRQGSFEPVLVPKRQRRLEGFNEKVLALYARGLTTRDIQGHLEELYGVEVSPTLISTITDAVLEDVRTWQSRPLDAVYPILYFDCLFVKSRQEGVVKSKAVYVALGVTPQGEKELLGLWVSETEGAKFWLAVFTELNQRGVQDCFVACVDGLSGLPEALETVLPHTQVQLCIVHKVRQSLQYVIWKERRAVARDLRAIYGAATLHEAEAAFEKFAATWAAKSPTISATWRRDWARLTVFFDYPPEIRKVIYTTNAIESLNFSLRKVLKSRGAFPTDDIDSESVLRGDATDRQEMDGSHSGLETCPQSVRHSLRRSSANMLSQRRTSYTVSLTRPCYRWRAQLRIVAPLRSCYAPDVPSHGLRTIISGH